jgi:hypothetical protein
LKTLVVRGLHELCDQTVWERWSPTEIVCELFDDSGLAGLLERGAVFSGEADNLLRALGEKVTQVDLDQPPEALSRDPRWQEIQALARATLRLVGP